MNPDDTQQFVSLRDHFQSQIDHLTRLMEQHNRTSQQAIDKAEMALGRRLDGMNEFREALRDQSTRMVTREQYDVLREQVNTLDKRVAVSAAVTSLLVSLIVSLVVALATGRWL